MIDYYDTQLIFDYLKLAYPKRRMRLPINHNQRDVSTSRGNFRNVIVISPDRILKVSKKDERQVAMYDLVKILSRVFNLPDYEITPIVKNYLHLD